MNNNATIAVYMESLMSDGLSRYVELPTVAEALKEAKKIVKNADRLSCHAIVHDEHGGRVALVRWNKGPMGWRLYTDRSNPFGL